MRSYAGLIAMIVLVTSAACVNARAADSHDTSAAPAHNESAPSAAHESHTSPATNQPALPPEGIRWPAVMLIVVAGMFVAAMVVGPVVRLTLPAEEPSVVAHAHHDDSHGHGHGHTARPRTPLDGHGGHH